MSVFLNRIKSQIYEWRQMLLMLMWDIILAVALIVILQIALMSMENGPAKIILFAVIVATMIVSLAVRYIVFYNKHGRDDVTNGMNKREFERVAKLLLNGSGTFAVVYANVDRFKLINDSYGNEIGDQVLRLIHKVIENEMLRWDEASGRIMADNFGMLMRYHSMEMLEHRLHRINELLAELRDQEGNTYGIKMYFGVYLVEDKNEPVANMLECANLALKKALRSSQHMVHVGVYDLKEKEQLNREKELEMKMEKALRRGEFIPFLQPKFELGNETIGGAEALCRWVDPEEGMIFPGEFIPLFEKNGFITKLDLYMFEEVCRMVERWHRKGYEVIPVSVNMSRSHFLIPDFFDAYREVLSRYDVPLHSIEIELTESLFYNELSTLKNLIAQIHEVGMLCSIDDFGSGYSSLNMLKDIEVDTLKLDRVFFRDVADDARGKSVISSVLHLAQSLELRTVSEGVEERSQVDYLKEMECDYIQGYVFAKPMPVLSFEKLAFGEKKEG